MSKPNPDNRKDNVERIQKNINSTIRNMELADELISETSNEEERDKIKAKNDRRHQALEGMRSEIKDEANARRNDYK